MDRFSGCSAQSKLYEMQIETLSERGTWLLVVVVVVVVDPASDGSWVPSYEAAYL